MSVRDGMPHLPAALDSIAAQSLQDYELIVVDDASSDQSGAMLAQRAAADARVRVLTNQRNLGLTKSLNRALTQARGMLIARQDADDMSLPGRLAAQAAFLAARPEVGLVGCAIHTFDQHDRHTGTVTFPLSDTAIRWHLLFGNAFCHTAAMFRRETLERAGGGYDESLSYSQDYELWCRMLEHCRGANLAEPLVRFREHQASISEQRREPQQRIADDIAQKRMLDLVPDLGLDQEQIRRLRNWFMDFPTILNLDSVALYAVYLRLLRALAARPGLDRAELARIRRGTVDRILSALPPAKLAVALAGPLACELGPADLPALAAHLPRRLLRRLLPGRGGAGKGHLRPPGQA